MAIWSCLRRRYREAERGCSQGGAAGTGRSRGDVSRAQAGLVVVSVLPSWPRHRDPLPLASQMFPPCGVPADQDSDSDSDLSLDEERSLSIPSSESEENVRLRGRFQRGAKHTAHSERLLTHPANTAPKGRSWGSGGKG